MCDTAATRGSGTAPLVTSIAGQLSPSGRSAPMSPTQAILATHRGATYVIWRGQRSRIDPTDRSVTFNLGLDPGVTYPIEISNALFDAMPSTEPLVLPVIPGHGTPSRWLAGTPVGSVLETRDASGTVNGFYVLLADGVQKITSFVADLLRTANSEGSTTPALVAPDKLIQIPVIDVLDVDYYPSGKAGIRRHVGEPDDMRRVGEAIRRPAGQDHASSLAAAYPSRSAWTLAWCILSARTATPIRLRRNRR